MAKSRRRNPYALHPLMHKGGVHGKSTKARRSAAKLATRKLVDESRSAAHSIFTTRKAECWRSARCIALPWEHSPALPRARGHLYVGESRAVW